jgi:hypothetical protein
MPIDPITHRKLVIVKQLYQQAIIHSSSFSMAGKIITLICFDCSIETILNTVVGFLDSTKKPADKFPGLVEQCEKLMSKSSLGPIPDKANILHIHSLRNDAQHEAKYPNDSDISDCRTYTRDFHNRLLNQLWGISLENINLTDLIQHAQVKQFLIDAEAALSKNNYVGAVENASAALSTALELVDSAIVGRKPSFISGAFMMSDGFGRSVKPDRDVFQAFKRMQQVLLYVSLGIRYSDYMRYHAIVGYTSFTMDVKHHTTGMKQPLEANDAEFVVSYCIDTIAQIEGQVGSLDAPFGKEHLLY